MSEQNEITRKFTRELPVTLNEHELQTYGKMLAEKVREEELAEEKKKQVAAEHSNRIKVIRQEVRRIADARAKGEELRPVHCGERLRGNVIEIVRLDRGEVVDTRPAELTDLQTTLPGTDIPEAPEDFSEGPRGEQLGSLADQPVEHTGEMVTSSAGDQVYVSDDVDETHSEGGEYTETSSDDAPDEDDGTTQTAAAVLRDVAELDDDELDRRLAEREEQQRADEAAAAGKKPTRERSKSKNDAKGKGTKKKK